MSRLAPVSDWLGFSLGEIAARHAVPGVSVAVRHRGETVCHAAGLLNVRTGVEADVDSIFQIGSVTKVFTATLVMQLQDEGLVDLDDALGSLLPGAVRGSGYDQVTLRQLLSHTAGFDGDRFVDTGKGDDCLERLVDQLPDAARISRPGELFSYNNLGYCLLGRIVELARGRSYDEALRQFLLEPLGLASAATDPYEAVLHRAAVGHTQPPGAAAAEPVTRWALPRSNAAAGAMLAMTARDLVAFAAMHLDDGQSADRRQVLSASGTREMTETVITQPPRLGSAGTAWGLGWELYDWPTGNLLGHTGGTIGQGAVLYAHPGSGVSLAILANGGRISALQREIATRVLAEVAGLDVPAAPRLEVAAPRPATSGVVGRYAAGPVEVLVAEKADGLWLTYDPGPGDPDAMGERSTREIAFLTDRTAMTVEPGGAPGETIIFTFDEEGQAAAFVHVGGRAHVRVGELR